MTQSTKTRWLPRIQTQQRVWLGSGVRRNLRAIIFLSTCFALVPFHVCLHVCHGAETNSTRLPHAVQQYQEAMESKDPTRRLSLFSRAEQRFRQIIEGDSEHPPIQNAYLYVNLGNAALQAEHIGPAIVAYRKALAMAPQHAQARQNLAHARSLLPTWARYDNSDGLIDSLFFWRSLLTVGQIKVGAASCFLLAAGLIAIGIARTQSMWRNLAAVPVVIWIVLLASLRLDPDQTTLHNTVVIDETTVYTADSANAPPRLSKPLPSGTELKLIQRRDRWAELELPDGRTGWVRSGSIRQLNEE